MKHIIIGFKDHKRFYLVLEEDGSAHWSENEKDASVYASYDMALNDWFELNKSQFDRVFIASRQPIK